MKNIYINGIGLVAPGLEGWKKGKHVLANTQPFEPSPLEKYKPQRLPPNERRRATELVRLAFRVCEDAVTSDIDPSQLATVFASSEGDNNIFDQICRALKHPQRAVSPTQFHNSVHNSAAGYWSIATKGQQASTSLSSFDDSFGSALLEAAGQLEVDGTDVLLAIFDIKPPPPLSHCLNVNSPFAAAFVLSHHKTKNNLFSLDVSLTPELIPESTMDLQAFEGLRLGNPSARALPLLAALAESKPKALYFNLPGNALSVSVNLSPC